MLNRSLPVTLACLLLSLAPVATAATAQGVGTPPAPDACIPPCEVAFAEEEDECLNEGKIVQVGVTNEVSCDGRCVNRGIVIMLGLSGSYCARNDCVHQGLLVVVGDYCQRDSLVAVCSYAKCWFVSEDCKCPPAARTSA